MLEQDELGFESMAQLTGLSPLDYAASLFTNFTRLYYTQKDPINIVSSTPEQPAYFAQVRYSVEARQTLLCVYNTLLPLVTHNEYEALMLRTYYLQAIHLIHHKFGTTQTTDPFYTHLEA